MWPRHSGANRNKQAEAIFQLWGGLGNQLFGYHAGLYFANHNKVDVKFDISRIHRGHGRGILDFKIPQNLFEKPIKSLAKNITFGTLDASPQIKEGINKWAPRGYLSPVNGYDYELIKQSGNVFGGFFQTDTYLNLLRDLGAAPTFEIDKPSTWYSQMLTRAEVEEPIAIHLRLGDYKYLKSEFGLLSVDYYRNALIETRLRTSDRPVWVFSDNAEEAKEFFKDFVIDFYVQPNSRKAGAESMLLMSKCHSIVIANSTYSWWAAQLGSPKNVAYPKTWFVAQPNKRDFIPDRWIAIDSVWR